IAADQVRHVDLTEMDAERVDPERVRELRIARRDVPRDSLVEAEFGKQAKSRRKFLLSMPSLIGQIVEFRRRRQLPHQLRWIDGGLGLDVHGLLPGSRISRLT